MTHTQTVKKKIAQDSRSVPTVTTNKHTAEHRLHTKPTPYKPEEDTVIMG